MTLKLERRSWWGYLEEDLQELLKEALLLIDIFEKRTQMNNSGTSEFHDYAFVIFPAAKAYEGFLKKLFLDLGFITKEDYFGKRFRIGKALNPYLDKAYRAESVYDDLVNYCGGKELADMLWETWRVCRNLTFHWFPDEKNIIDLEGAKARLEMIVEALDLAVKECKIKYNNK